MQTLHSTDMTAYQYLTCNLTEILSIRLQYQQDCNENLLPVVTYICVTHEKLEQNKSSGPSSQCVFQIHNFGRNAKWVIKTMDAYLSRKLKRRHGKTLCQSQWMIYHQVERITASTTVVYNNDQSCNAMVRDKRTNQQRRHHHWQYGLTKKNMV
jgi:hypothetical protein